MKILLICPPPNISGKSNFAVPPLGLLYIASVVRNDNEVSLIDANALQLNVNQIFDKVKENCPDIVGLYTNIVNMPVVINLIKRIKSYNKNIFIVLGGPFVSSDLHKKVFLQYLHLIDFIVRGEGEITFKELVNLLNSSRYSSKDLKKIRGLTFKDKNQIIINLPRELVHDLDTIPFPNWDLLPSLRFYNSYKTKRKPFMPILFSRGCPERCSYCNKSVFGWFFRMRGLENIKKEVNTLITKYKIKELCINDDNFLVNKERSIQIIKYLKKLNISIRFYNGLRLDLLDEEVIKLLKDAGVYYLTIPIESANYSILEKVHKRLNLEHSFEMVKLCKKIGILTTCNIILGLPGETSETLSNNIKFSKKLDTDILYLFYFYPIPSTEAYQYACKHGKFTSDYLRGSFFYKPTWVDDNLTIDELIESSKNGYKQFYNFLKIIITFIRFIKYSSLQEAVEHLKEMINKGFKK